MTWRRTRRGFSLVELVIVIVIIGVIAAIAIPRISRGAKGASDSALRADLAALRSAIDLYAAEHTGSFPTVANFATQLTTKTDIAGAAGSDYGPYLRSIPGLPVAGVGANTGAIGDTGVAAAAAANIAWIYTATTGDIVANTGTAADDGGTVYNTY